MKEETIFHLALQKPRGDRSAFLDVVCEADAELRSRVERLLDEHERGESFILDTPPANLGATIDSPTAERPGTVIGPYKLLQQIGEGGMGAVFMAEQSAPIQRTVALKIIKPGMDTRQVIARFEAERQALAMMDHPNIAKVLDAGTTPSGRPYFVMELVKGVPITTYCDEKRLPLRERLNLFVEVCQAVQHAHQKGIIHRDIKPTNVLVAEYDNQAVPKVIDFGVANATAQKLTERTMFTEFGQMIGTVEYMSPEQAKLNQLDIDTRSDIYSLGVLMYELLAGSTPFARKRLNEAAFDEMLRIIREEEPPTPSTRISSTEGLPSIAANRCLEPLKLNRAVRGELDWIVMKALEKDRNRRYETANGLAQDVGHYLVDEPVEAGPPTAAYRFRKLARRNKAALVAASLILLTLIAGVLGTTIGLIRAEDARRTAEEREAETRAILDFVQNKVLAAAGPEGEDGGLGREVSLRTAIDSALPFVESNFPHQPAIEARLRMTLGTAFLNLGEASVAADQFQKARLLRTECLEPDHPDTLASINNLAAAYADLGRYADALKLNEQILTMRKAKLGYDHPDTLKSMSTLSFRYYQLGRYDEALALSDETLPLMRAKLGPDDPSTLGLMTSLAVSYVAMGRYEEALRLREETLALMRLKLGADSRYTLAGMNNLANSYATSGRYDDALKLREDVLEIRKAKLGLDHPLTLRSMENLACSYMDLGRHADALGLLEESLLLAKSRLGGDHPVTLRIMGDIARTYYCLNRDKDALRLYQQTLALSQAKLGTNHPDTLTLMWGVAAMLVELNRAAEAAPIIEDCLKRSQGNIVRSELVPGLTLLRIRNFQQTNDAAGCRATAEMYEQLPLTKPSEFYDAACLRAIVAAMIEHDRQTPSSDVSRLAGKEADRAMAMLKKAVAAGFRDVQHIREDVDLIALRNREDYQQLVAELEGKTNAAPSEKDNVEPQPQETSMTPD